MGKHHERAKQRLKARQRYWNENTDEADKGKSQKQPGSLNTHKSFSIKIGRR